MPAEGHSASAQTYTPGFDARAPTRCLGSWGAQTCTRFGSFGHPRDRILRRSRPLVPRGVDRAPGIRDDLVRRRPRRIPRARQPDEEEAARADVLAKARLSPCIPSRSCAAGPGGPMLRLTRDPVRLEDRWPSTPRRSMPPPVPGVQPGRCLKGTETLITHATCPFTNGSLYGPRMAAEARSMPRPPLNARFLSFKHSSLGWRASTKTRCGTSQIVSQGCLSMTGRRSESTGQRQDLNKCTLQARLRRAGRRSSSWHSDPSSVALGRGLCRLRRLGGDPVRHHVSTGE